MFLLVMEVPVIAVLMTSVENKSYVLAMKHLLEALS
jgi:hypothetical protein